jgi:hypothetical protein
MIKEIGRTGYPVPKEQPPPETLRPKGPIKTETLERGILARRRDNDLRQKDRGGIKRRKSASVLVPECPFILARKVRIE